MLVGFSHIEARLASSTHAHCTGVPIYFCPGLLLLKHTQIYTAAVITNQDKSTNDLRRWLAMHQWQLGWRRECRQTVSKASSTNCESLLPAAITNATFLYWLCKNVGDNSCEATAP